MPQRILNRVLVVVGLLFSAMLIVSVVFSFRIGVKQEVEQAHEQTRAAVERESELTRAKLDELLRRLPAATEPSR